MNETTNTTKAIIAQARERARQDNVRRNAQRTRRIVEINTFVR